MPTRRDALALAAAAAASPVLAQSPSAAEAKLAALERKVGGRLGVAALDTGSGRRIGYRADERFALCSTFKLLAVGAILARVDHGKEQLDRTVEVIRADVVGWAPVTEKHIGQRLPIATLCEAGLQWSDNGAANLMLDILGDPPAVTAFARSLGDPLTRLDRREPALNHVAPGEVRDTTTPRAMQEDLRRLILTPALTPPSRNRLIAWMAGNKTGDARIRAGVPKGWRVADKTGTGPEGGGVNDVAAIWPPGRAPILVSIYSTDSKAPAAERDAALAEATRILLQAL